MESRNALSGLPLEIWERILKQIPNSELQTTTSSLSRLLHWPFNHLRFKHLQITNDKQLKQLLGNQQVSHLTRSLSLIVWRLFDNHLLINLINNAALNIQFISLLIGPLFSPEQLEELFLSHKPRLQLISLRFNQNVSRRSYEPFLKGAYFDHCLDLLANWPESCDFHSLSFVQDPPPIHEQKSHLLNQGIAQPIILFRFWCITNLATSPIARNMIHLRLRIPARNIAVALTNNTTRFLSIQVGTQEFKLPVDAFPRLQFLDLSTSMLSSVLNGLAPLLRRFPRLQHLILDRTQLIFPARFEADMERVDDALRAMGTTVAASGIPRAMETARQWRDLHKLIVQELAQERLRANGIPRPPDDIPPPSPAAPKESSRRRGRSAYASAPRWKTAATSASRPTAPVTVVPIQGSSASTTTMMLSAQRVPDKVTFVPAPSKLVSLCCGTALPVDAEEGATRIGWSEQFTIGWTSGMSKLESAMREKLAEHERAMDVWTKAVARLDGSLGQEEDLSRLLAARPTMVMVDDTSPSSSSSLSSLSSLSDEEGDGLTGVFESFLHALGLREVSFSCLLQILAQFPSHRPPVLCTVNDCLAHGAVVWSPDRPVNLISPDVSCRSTSVDGADEQDLHAPSLDRLFQHHLHLHPSSSNTQAPTALPNHHHDPHCAHLLGRKLWHLDHW
ncbi:uncharacterized protein VP01_1707g3 [Puccinia sorghi]|uniref:F-box domain-containing protein n=1 Tax=Puccinia sorghi TaxID=27349 RepID=A0A0L6VFM8_9BASI|nr:uncharacterized protein VP01_1707g3 [Puccinia sorghi]